ncbi:cysteine hydrolase family protein [Ralstonia sp. R-29]|uniref:cysteine hydrolase family protein n=1 Tax=Ralstonia sp. R-29 TaxID=3404059 RepID=UPI003CF7004A
MSKQTLRSILGATAPKALPTSTALIAIDFQYEYYTGSLPIPNGAEALRQANKLINHADEKGWKVIHVQHVAPKESPLFAVEGPYVGIHADVVQKPTHRVFQKPNVSVFAGTDFAEQLKQNGITHLVICGLMTHACVAGAARDGAAAGFEIIVVDDASATRDIAVSESLRVSHDVLHQAALIEVSDTFGSVMNTADVLALNAA